MHAVLAMHVMLAVHVLLAVPRTTLGFTATTGTLCAQ